MEPSLLKSLIFHSQIFLVYLKELVLESILMKETNWVWRKSGEGLIQSEDLCFRNDLLVSSGSLELSFIPEHINLLLCEGYFKPWACFSWLIYEKNNSVKLFKDYVKWKEKRRECTIKFDKKDDVGLLFRNACYLFEKFLFLM